MKRENKTKKPAGLPTSYVYAYLDTNALVEFRPMRDNDWRGLLGAEHVVLVIAHVVVEELQKIKDGGGRERRKRQRAGELLKSLEELLFPGPNAPSAPAQVREGVETIYDGDATPPEIFSKYRLDTAQSDDRLVAALLAGRDGGRHVCLVSNDAGPRWKAKGQGLLAVDLPHDWRLSEELDPLETENRELKKKILVYESRAPKLSLRFPAGESLIRYTLPKPRLPLDEHARRQLEKLRWLCRPRDGTWKSAHEEILERIQGPPSKTAIDQYNRDLAKYFENVEKLIPSIIEHRNLRDLYAPVVGLTVSNDGNQPAEKVRVVLRLPPGLKPKRELPTKTRELPEAPEPPASWREELFSGHHYFPGALVPSINVSSISKALRARHEPAPPIWDFADGEIAISTGTVRHAMRHVLPRFYIVLPSYDAASSFHLEFKLHAYNIAPPVEGLIHVVVERGDKLSPLKLMKDQPRFLRDADEAVEPADERPDAHEVE